MSTEPATLLLLLVVVVINRPVRNIWMCPPYVQYLPYHQLHFQPRLQHRHQCHWSTTTHPRHVMFITQAFTVVVLLLLNQFFNNIQKNSYRRTHQK